MLNANTINMIEYIKIIWNMLNVHDPEAMYLKILSTGFEELSRVKLVLEQIMFEL